MEQTPKYRFNFYCTRNPHIDAIERSLRNTKLEDKCRESLIARYTSLLHDYNQRKGRYSWSFHSLRLIVTVGSLIVPAILSVQYTSGNVNDQTANLSTEVYWIVWTLSLFVTISNGIMTLLKMDKKYHSLHTTFEHLLSEAWQYVHLSGKYYGTLTPGESPTHENQFPFFCYYIEKVRMKQIEDEYYKTSEHEEGGKENAYQPKTPWRDPFHSKRDSTNVPPTQSSTQEVNDNQTTVTRRSNAAQEEV